MTSRISSCLRLIPWSQILLSAPLRTPNFFSYEGEREAVSWPILRGLLKGNGEWQDGVWLGETFAYPTTEMG